MLDVRQWLDFGADPDKGLLLLEKYGVSGVLLRIYQSAPDQYKEKIKDALIRLSGVDLQKQPSEKKKTNIIPFRLQFPFLNDPDCPIELKALVTDKFSSFFRYRDLHKELRNCATIAECSNTSEELLENYIENRQIYNEFNYYKNNKTLLGKHHIFKQYENIRAIRKLSIKELVLKQQQLEHNIWRIESELKKGNKPHLYIVRKESLSIKLAELAEVKRLLGE